ncbi:preprotein translocase subunit SecG [Planctomycetota bacterium]
MPFTMSSFLFLSSMIMASGAGEFWAKMLNLVFVLVALLLIFLVLIQKSSDGGGLGTAFGGSGSADSLFGVKTAAGIKYFTGWIAIGFMVLSLVIAKVTAANRMAAPVSHNAVIPTEDAGDTGGGEQPGPIDENQPQPPGEEPPGGDEESTPDESSSGTPPGDDDATEDDSGKEESQPDSSDNSSGE